MTTRWNMEPPMVCAATTEFVDCRKTYSPGRLRVANPGVGGGEIRHRSYSSGRAGFSRNGCVFREALPPSFLELEVDGAELCRAAAQVENFLLERGAFARESTPIGVAALSDRS